MHYCSSQCQKTHWREHKSSCPPVTVKETVAKGRAVFATRNIAAGQVIWTEEPLITYKKDPKGTPQAFLDNLYGVFQKLSDDKKQAMLSLYDPGEEAGRGEEKWKVCRIANVNEVGGGGGLENSVYSRYSRLNHSCCRNAVGQVSDTGGHQVRAIKKVAKGEEVTVSYLEGRLGTRAERRGLLQRKWGFLCDCPVCSLSEARSAANDEALVSVRQGQAAVITQKTGRSHTKALKDLHGLMADCYMIEDQNQSVLRSVLLAIVQGLRRVGGKEKNWLVFCPEEVRGVLETRLGLTFWADVATYEKEAIRVAGLFGHADKMVEYMT